MSAVISTEWVKQLQKIGSASDRRSSGRIQTEGVWTNLGVVLDLSRGGMRVMGKRKLQESTRVHFYSSEGEMELEARVRWCKRRGLRRFESGIQFDTVTPDQSQFLLKMVRAHSAGIAG